VPAEEEEVLCGQWEEIMCVCILLLHSFTVCMCILLLTWARRRDMSWGQQHGRNSLIISSLAPSSK
jgi:hypothetical protein